MSGLPPVSRNQQDRQADRRADVDEHPLGGPERHARGVQPQREGRLEVALLHDPAGELDRGPRDLAAAERGRALLLLGATGRPVSV